MAARQRDTTYAKAAFVEQRIRLKVVANVVPGERVVTGGPGFPRARTTLVNLTGRMIVLCAPDGEPLYAIPPSDRVARAGHVITKSAAVQVHGLLVPLYQDTLRLEADLPDPRPGVNYIVDYDVALACLGGARSRHDLLVPNGGVLDKTTGVLHVASFAVAELLA
jgi:hypothetical protein